MRSTPAGDTHEGEALEPLLADPADPFAAAYCSVCSASFSGAVRCSDRDTPLRPVAAEATHASSGL